MKNIPIIIVTILVLGITSYLFAGNPPKNCQYQIITAKTLDQLEDLIQDNAKVGWASGQWYVEGGICFIGTNYSVLMYKDK